MINQALEHVLADIREERRRQELLFKAGKIPFNCADPNVDEGQKLPVLVEELGEVAKAIQDVDYDQVRIELIQLAAVATAWAESLTGQDAEYVSAPRRQTNPK